MAEQLIFTSAPKGLKPGTRGYTTVAATRGISPPLMTRMEGMSGYRLAFNVSDARAAQNPVAYSHQLLSHGGVRASMLSRVAACGVDYSGRSNFLAHHILLEAAERTEAGPAWLLTQPAVLRQAWEGTPSYIDEPPPFPHKDIAPAPCRAWESAAGDAGWAGVLLEQLRDKPRSPVYIVYEAGTELLPLFAEAIALLPPKLRWRATFNTYFNNAAPEATCMWRGVLAGSPASTEFAKATGATAIDLTAGPRKAAENEFTKLARAGNSAEDLFATRPAPVARPAAASDPEDPIGLVANPEEEEFFDESKDYDFDVFDESPTRPSRAKARRSGSGMVISAAPPKRRQKGRGAMIAVVSVLLLVVLGVGFGLWRSSRFNASVESQVAKLDQLINDDRLDDATRYFDQIRKQDIAIAIDERIINVEQELDRLKRNDRAFATSHGDLTRLVEDARASEYVIPRDTDARLTELEDAARTIEQKNAVASIKSTLNGIRTIHRERERARTELKIATQELARLNNLNAEQRAKRLKDIHDRSQEVGRKRQAFHDSPHFTDAEKTKEPLLAEATKEIRFAEGLLREDVRKPEPDPGPSNPEATVVGAQETPGRHPLYPHSRRRGNIRELRRILLNAGQDRELITAGDKDKFGFLASGDDRTGYYTITQETKPDLFLKEISKQKGFQVTTDKSQVNQGTLVAPEAITRQANMIFFASDARRDPKIVFVTFEPSKDYALTESAKEIGFYDERTRVKYMLELPRIRAVDIGVKNDGTGSPRDELKLPTGYDLASSSNGAWLHADDAWVYTKIKGITVRIGSANGKQSDSGESARPIEVTIHQLQELHSNFQIMKERLNKLKRMQSTKSGGPFEKRLEVANAKFKKKEQEYKTAENQANADNLSRPERDKRRKAANILRNERDELKVRRDKLEKLLKELNELRGSDGKPGLITSANEEHAAIRGHFKENNVLILPIGPNAQSHQIKLTLHGFPPL